MRTIWPRREILCGASADSEAGTDTFDDASALIADESCRRDSIIRARHDAVNDASSLKLEGAPQQLQTVRLLAARAASFATSFKIEACVTRPPATRLADA
ncbi:MAG: hypothetical protein DPW13_05265 [Planctomycetes bacterium]|nr:hypothetical protein [Planctomycetota bacterium]